MNYYIEQLYTKTIENRLRVFTSVSIKAKTPILKLSGALLKNPNKYSIQIKENVHLDRSFEIDDELNHSCKPNCYIDFNNFKLKSICNIDAGEELTINYCCTEDVLSKPFLCDCKNIGCYGEVKGFKFLDRNIQESLKEFISPYLYYKYFNKNNKR